MKNYVTGYMCRIDFECELGSVQEGTKIYPTLEDLYKNHPCADDCGIVEVFILLKDIIVEGNYN